MDWGTSHFTLSVFGLTALVYGALHLFRPRSYVWSAALLSALAAFFTLFQLPAMERLEVPFVYQLLIATNLLVVPELGARTRLTLKSESVLQPLYWEF
jgi:hypothetical protein